MERGEVGQAFFGVFFFDKISVLAFPMSKEALPHLELAAPEQRFLA